MYVALQLPPTSSLYVFDGRCAMFAWLTGHPLYSPTTVPYAKLLCRFYSPGVYGILYVYYRNRLVKYMRHGYVPFTVLL